MKLPKEIEDHPAFLALPDADVEGLLADLSAATEEEYVYIIQDTINYLDTIHNSTLGTTDGLELNDDDDLMLFDDFNF